MTTPPRADVSKLPYRNLPQLFLRSREALLRHFRPIITHFGLTEQQWRILRVLAESGELEPREICEICQILSPSLAGVLARVEELDLVSRSRMPGDQRRVLVRLTAKSEALVAELGPLIMAQYKLIEQALGPDLLQELYAVLDKVQRAELSHIPQVPLPPRRESQ